MSKTLLKSHPKRRRVVYPVQEVDPKFLTQKQFVNECNVNLIVENAKRGIPPKFQNIGTPHYGDFTDVPTIERAYDTVMKAQEAFLTLPAALRAELDNDPAQLGRLTEEQAVRYKLTKNLPEPGTPPPSQTSPGSSAGQAQSGGTEPPAPSGKAGPKASGN